MVAESLSQTGFINSAIACYREMREEWDRPLTRRQSFARMAHLVLNVGGFFVVVRYAGNLPGIRKPNPAKVPVKKFAKEIIYASIGNPTPNYLNIVRNDVNDYNANLLPFLIGLSMTTLITKKPDNDFALAFYGASGATALTGRALDEYSTIVFSRTMQDPRFKEYGLDKFFGEQNAILPIHPKKSDILNLENLSREALVVGLGTVCIPLGMAIGTLGLDAFFHNLRGNYLMHVAMDIGDQVKHRLAHGHTEGQIMEYLDTVRANGLEKANSLYPLNRPNGQNENSGQSPLVANYFRRFGIKISPRI